MQWLKECMSENKKKKTLRFLKQREIIFENTDFIWELNLIFILSTNS